MKTGLVLEGGALRTIFSSGVCDAFLNEKLPMPDYTIGVSAGIAYGVSYLSRQKRRNLQLLMHPVNIDVSALNLYLVWSQPIRRWTPNVTVGMYRQRLQLDNYRYDKPIFSYYFDNTFSIPKGWTITANISGSSHGDMHTNRFGASWFTMDASIGKTFLNKSLTVKLSATDMFNSANNDWTMNTYGVYVDKRQSYDHRGVSLNIIYNLQPSKSKYKGASAAEEEMKRL